MLLKISLWNKLTCWPRGESKATFYDWMNIDIFLFNFSYCRHMPHWFRALDTFPEDPGLISSIHMET